MQKYHGFARDDDGNAVPSATIQVFETGTTTPVQLYSDDGVTVMAQPIASNALGYFNFYCDDQRVDIEIIKTGVPATKLVDVMVADFLSFQDPLRGRWIIVTDDPYNAAGDGITDDTAAIQAAFDAAAAAGCGAVLIPPGTYIVNGDMMTFGSNLLISGYGATLKLQAGTYGAMTYFLGTREDVAYTGAGYVENVTIEGLRIDGSIANITTTSGCTGIQGHQVRDFIVRDCEVFDLPGTSGNGYGIAAWYSERVNIESCHVSRSDRQNILIWETTGAVVNGCHLKDSYFRGNILVSSMSPATLQGSHVIISDNTLQNTLAGGGGTNRGIRFSGQSGGVISNCDVSATNEGIAIIDDYSKDIIIRGCRFTDCTYGVWIDVDTAEWVLSVSDCVIKDSSARGIQALAGPGRLTINGCTITGSATNPIYTDDVDYVNVTGCTICGGTVCTFKPAEMVVFADNLVTGLTEVGYAVFINGTSLGLCSYSGNILSGNVADKPYITSFGEVSISWTGFTPEGNITAQVGATCTRMDSSDTFYIKESGAAGNGWVLTSGGGIGSESLVIAAGVITVVAATAFTKVEVDTQGMAGADNLDTITGGAEGQILILHAKSGVRVPTVRDDGTSGGNILLDGNVACVLDEPEDRLMLQKNGANWVELSRSDNA